MTATAARYRLPRLPGCTYTAWQWLTASTRPGIVARRGDLHARQLPGIGTYWHGKAPVIITATATRHRLPGLPGFHLLPGNGCHLFRPGNLYRKRARHFIGAHIVPAARCQAERKSAAIYTPGPLPWHRHTLARRNARHHDGDSCQCFTAAPPVTGCPLPSGRELPKDKKEKSRFL